MKTKTKGLKRSILPKDKLCNTKSIELGYDPVTGNLAMADSSYVPFKDLNPDFYKKVTYLFWCYEN